MHGIPFALLKEIRDTLQTCDYFEDQEMLNAIFQVDKLKHWQGGLPSANNKNRRILLTINYLIDKHNTNGENALFIFLNVLGNLYGSTEDLHSKLLNLSKYFKWISDLPPTLKKNSFEANPSGSQMLLIAEAEKLLDCAKAVGKIDIPCINDGKETKRITGTAWLVTPELAITCWHVISARDDPRICISTSDLKEQTKNALLTFNYTISGKGFQYSIKKLEYPLIGSNSLDYAILRVLDRDDRPLHDQGFLLLDIDTPMTLMTSLYIIQHPLGQAQQVAGDFFVKNGSKGAIFYKTPTEPGTSGAPVFNRTNWRVVALHSSEDTFEHLREGIQIKSILSDLKENRPELYGEIIDCQKMSE